jgi:hypothetical protein
MTQKLIGNKYHPAFQRKRKKRDGGRKAHEKFGRGPRMGILGRRPNSDACLV